MFISLLFKGILRGGIPFGIMSIIAVMLHFQGKTYQARSTFFVALIVLFVGLASVIYDINSLSLFERSIIHFLSMLITVYPILLVSGWFPLTNAKDALAIFLYFACFGAVIYTIMLTLAKVFKW